MEKFYEEVVCPRHFLLRYIVYEMAHELDVVTDMPGIMESSQKAGMLLKRSRKLSIAIQTSSTAIVRRRQPSISKIPTTTMALRYLPLPPRTRTHRCHLMLLDSALQYLRPQISRPTVNNQPKMPRWHGNRNANSSANSANQTANSKPTALTTSLPAPKQAPANAPSKTSALLPLQIGLSPAQNTTRVTWSYVMQM